MAITVCEPKSNFNPAPEGLFTAVCVDVVDMGEMETQWGMKRKIQIRWQLDEKDPDTGRPFMIAARYTASLSEKATLRHILETWRSKKFTPEELQGFDLEKLIGVNCQIQIVHNPGDQGRVYANVLAVVPAAKGAEKIRPVDYVREKDRAKNGNAPAPEVDNGDVPF